MDLFPAIDLQNGHCVRLAQGVFTDVTIYEQDPQRQAGKFKSGGAEFLHVVDLDGAKAGAPQQTHLLQMLPGQGLKVQAGGGIRKAEHVQALLDAGVWRVVVGSLAVTDPQRVKDWLSRFGAEKIILAFDVELENGRAEIMSHGWQKGSGIDMFECLEAYLPSGLRSILCTDIARDGMMTGANTALYSSLMKTFPQLEIIASGGIGHLGDIRALHETGVSGVIVGKALYENKFTLEEALKETASAR